HTRSSEELVVSRISSYTRVMVTRYQTHDRPDSGAVSGVGETRSPRTATRVTAAPATSPVWGVRVRRNATRRTRSHTPMPAINGNPSAAVPATRRKMVVTTFTTPRNTSMPGPPFVDAHPLAAQKVSTRIVRTKRAPQWTH